MLLFCRLFKFTPRGFVVASRDTAPYTAAKVTVINPWDMR